MAHCSFNEYIGLEFSTIVTRAEGGKASLSVSSDCPMSEMGTSVFRMSLGTKFEIYVPIPEELSILQSMVSMNSDYSVYL